MDGHPERESGTRLCFFGAAPDTGNLGVSALCFSTLTAVAEHTPEAEVCLFDHGRGVRSGDDLGIDGLRIVRIGAHHSRRYHRSDTLWNMRVRGWLGGLGNRGVQAVRGADAVLDVSGGDSFTDLYGLKRFTAVTLPKRIAIEQGTPLILLPQTYGPFASGAVRRAARRIVQGAAMAWARDERSFDALRDLLGDAYDPERHLLGVDVAFGLESVDPQAALPETASSWLAGDAGGEVIGLNVSGLIYNDAAEAEQRYRLRADYRETIHRLVEGLLEETDARILLVPHVVTPEGHYESDTGAAGAVAARFEGHRDRITVLPPLQHPSEIKGIIARLDWFCGTRMHSTIAGLSSGVPTAAIAYSGKTRGVFESCGQGERVADPRKLDTDATVEHLLASFRSREESRAGLKRALPSVLRQAREQMEEIAAFCAPITA